MSSRTLRLWPVFVGILGGWGLLWWRGAALVLDGRPAGYQWPAWVFSAWNWRHGHTHMLDPFRDPLHPIVVGLLGESLGYPDAALLVAGVAMASVVATAAMVATLLGDRWAGALTALTLPFSPVAASGARWATAYPLVTATMSAALAAAVWAARRPGRWPLALCAGALALSLLTDDRGILALPAALALVAVGKSTPRRRLGAVLVLLLAVGLGRLAAPALGQPDGLSWTEKRGIQTRVVRRWSTQTRDAAMREACDPVPQARLLTLAFLETPCAPAILRHNARDALPAATAWPAWALAVGALLWLVRRRTSHSWALLLPVAGVTAVSATFTPLPARYLLIFTGLLAPWVPVGLATVLRPTPDWLRGVACLGVFAAVFTADPHHFARHPVHGIDARWEQPGKWAHRLQLLMGPADTLLDCAGTYVEVALLPGHVGPMGPQLSVPDDRPCLQWLDHARTDSHRTPHLLVPLPAPEGRVDLDARADAHPGWERVTRWEDAALWRRVAGTEPAGP